MSGFQWPQAGSPVHLSDCGSVVTLHHVQGGGQPSGSPGGQLVGTGRVWVRVDEDLGGPSLWLRAAARSAQAVRRQIEGCTCWHDVPLAVQATAWVAEPAP